jgi:hypothetical protein
VLNARLAGGVVSYYAMIPNRTFCTDGRLTRVGFMVPDDVKAFVENLQGLGLQLRDESGFLEMAVVDQLSGPTLPCTWLRFDRHPEGFSSVRLADEPSDSGVAVPDGWTSEQSKGLHFVSNEDKDDRLITMSEDQGDVVFLDTQTGRERYLARVDRSGSGPVRLPARAFPLMVRHEKFAVWWVNHVDSWQGLGQVLGSRADAYLPFFDGLSSDDPEKINLTLRGLILGVLVSNEAPSEFARTLTDPEFEQVIHFASRAIGADPDECISSAAAYLAEHFDDLSAVQALQRARVLMHTSVIVRGDLVVRLFQLAEAQHDLADVLLREAALVFTELTPGATARCTNEVTILICGIASLWFTGAEPLAREAFMAHRDRVRAHPAVVEGLQAIGMVYLD